MYRYSIPKDAIIGTNDRQLVEAGITPDDDFPESLRDTGEYRDDERYFRVENVSAGSPEEAIAYAQGVIHTSPSRVWIDGEMFDAGDIDDTRIDKPGA